MPFTNPTVTLPASNISGLILGTQISPGAITTPLLAAGAVTAATIAAGAINGQTITGATVQTAASGRRVVMQNDGSGNNLTFYSGAAGELPGALQLGSDTSGTYVNLTPPVPSGYGGQITEISMRNNPTAATGSVVITSDVLAITGQLTNNLTGQTITALVQDWTTVSLASTYVAGTGGGGTPQYRVVTIHGTNWVEWRGSVGIGYTGTTANNSANFLASALPYAPSSGRPMICAAQWLSQWSVRVDFQTGGATSIVGTGASYAPAWFSLHGVRYPL